MKNFLVILFAVRVVVIAQPKFGVLVNGKMNPNIKISVAKELNVSYIRLMSPI